MPRQAEIVITAPDGHHGYIQRTGDQDIISQILTLLRIAGITAPADTVTIVIGPEDV